MNELENVVLDEEVKKEEPGHHHSYSHEDDYVVPKEQAVLDQLEWFKDQKLGLMMHWGTYSQLGMVESWGICDEDWTYAANDWQENRVDFKNDYIGLNKSFNPVRFNPDLWADIAHKAGFKYLIFTTKHHDGFCMWDSKYTDYKITAPSCPFSDNKWADICKSLFDSFRAKGFGIATYFSKADWNTPYYWDDDINVGVTQDRNPSYDVEKKPEMWAKFCEFTKNQILELMQDYGKIDVLWLDAGWVCKENGQDIKLGEIVDEARKTQPWLISADRTVGGAYENYITPEQTIPPMPISVPWESNITLGNSFSYAYDDTYKTSRKVVEILVDIVAKGGNLALNIGPQPDGRLPQKAIESILGLGEWLNVNGDAIYGTRVAAPYRKDDFGFTQKNGNTYAIWLFNNENIKVPEEILIQYTSDVSNVSVLGCSDTVIFKKSDDGIIVTVPKSLITEFAPIAITFVLK